MKGSYPDNDVSVKRKIEDYLYWKNALNESTVHVMVADGTITLSGTVPSETMCAALEEDVAKISDRYRVKNLLSVWSSETGKQHSDDELQNTVERALTSHVGIGGVKAEVQVDKGHVTLEGQVNADWKKSRAEKAVEAIVGVKQVSNRLKVGKFIEKA